MKDFKCYTVEVENGVQYLYFNGNKLPHQMLSIVRQDVEMIKDEAVCEITVTVLAILKDTK